MDSAVLFDLWALVLGVPLVSNAFPSTFSLRSVDRPSGGRGSGQCPGAALALERTTAYQTGFLRLIPTWGRSRDLSIPTVSAFVQALLLRSWEGWWHCYPSLRKWGLGLGEVSCLSVHGG